MGVDGAGEPGEGGAQGEGEQAQPEAVDAHGDGGGFVLADGDPGAADAEAAARRKTRTTKAVTRIISR